jgi:acyl transferase domain-containing protein
MNICTTVTDDVPMVAVVGMAGRFPQASGIAEFWDNLCAGRECLKRFTAAELRAAGVPQALCADERYVPVNGVLADVELFDAAFFGMTPRDASITDPQQRIFLELAWDALEHAGYDPGRYPGRIGVYAGCGPSSYFPPQPVAQSRRARGHRRTASADGQQSVLPSHAPVIPAQSHRPQPDDRHRVLHVAGRHPHGLRCVT